MYGVIETGLSGVLAVAHDSKVFSAQKNRNGQCYRYAYEFVSVHPDWTLVHGELRGISVRAALNNYGEDRYFHAWATKGDLIYEPLHNRIYTAKNYQIWAEPEAHHTYSNRGEIMDAMAEIGTYGPWVDAPAPLPRFTAEQFAALAALNGG